MKTRPCPAAALDACVRGCVEHYFAQLGGETAAGVYTLMLAAFEKPLLEVVMAKAAGNQSVAAAYLGINRNTLRKKLVEHQLI